MLEEGLSYPVKGDNALGRIVIGGLLGFFSWLVVPAFALLGYLVWVLEGAARNDPDPPAFEDWGEMLGDGLKAFVVTLVYGIVPFALLVFGMVVAMGGAASGSDSAAGLLGSVGLLTVLLGLVAMFLLYYLIPAALTNMAVEGDVGAAFDWATLKQVLLSGDYLVAWLLPFAIGLVANIVTFVLVLLTVGIGALLVPFIQFYVQVSIFFMFGRAFGSVLGTGEGGDATAADEAAPA